MIWFALPPLVYLGLCGLMYARQRDLVYCPHETRVAADQTDFALVHDGVTLRGWVVNPGRQQALIYFGGNAEPVQVNRDRFTRWFPEHTVYLMAYRGFGASEGEPTEAGITSDALALFDHVERLHPDSGIDVIGRSLGSGVAAHVAARRPVRRLALVTPYDTLADVGQAHYRWLPIHLLARERYDSVSNLSRYTGPILVVRAGQDTVIPAANTQRLINSLPRPPKVLQLRTADHSSIAFAPALARTMKLFFATPGYGGVAKVSRKSPTVPRSQREETADFEFPPSTGRTGHAQPAIRSPTEPEKVHMTHQGECPKCGKRLLHVRIETIVGQNNGNDDVRCLSYSCIHCNAVLHVQLDPRAKQRRRSVAIERAV